MYCEIIGKFFLVVQCISLDLVFSFLESCILSKLLFLILFQFREDCEELNFKFLCSFLNQVLNSHF